jgi:hypothetical protein
VVVHLLSGHSDASEVKNINWVAFIFHCANDAPFEPPLTYVVVHLLSAHNDANNVKNTIGNLPHLGLFVSICKIDTAHEFYQMAQDELG